MQQRRKLTDTDKRLILSLIQDGKSDQEIADTIGRNIQVVRKYRKNKLSIIKGSKGVINLERTGDQVKTVIAKGDKSREEKIVLLKKAFLSTSRYKKITEKFLPKDHDRLAEMWAKHQIDMPDLKTAEEDMLELLIIYTMRVEQNQKDFTDCQLEEERLRNELGTNSSIQEMDLEDESKRFIYEMITSLSGRRQEINKELQILSKNLDEIQKNLSISRQQREERQSVGRETFLSIINMLTDESARDKVGKYNELMKLAAEKKEKEFKESHKFMDGVEEPILLDGNDYVKKDVNNGS